MIEILATGPVNSVQDTGRFGYRAQGVSTSGAMDPLSMDAANLLVGNPESAAALEIQSFPLRVKFLSRTRFATTGAVAPVILGDRTLPCNWSALAAPGQELEVGRPTQGARCYLALAGGIDVPRVLGSRSTHLRNNFGGLEGREVKQGDRIGTGDATTGPAYDGGLLAPMAFATPQGDALTLRVVAGADYELFPEDRRESFWSTEWRITPQSNRSGYRLRGASLTLAKTISLYSYGVMQGIVQVPPSGEPIIQMADANTAGGYPRIGGVIEADLWKLGQASIGCKLRFKRVDFLTAVAARDELDTYLNEVRRGLRLFAL